MTDVTSLAFAHELERREARGGLACVAAHRRVIAGSRAEALERDGAVAVFASVGSPLSRVLALGVDAPVSEDTLDRIVAFYRERGVPCRLDLSPFVDRMLLEAIGRRGAQPRAWKMVLARPLDGATPARSFPGVAVEPADEVTLWGHTVEHGFAGHPLDPEDAALEVPRTLFALEGARCFLARVDGVPAGGGFVSIRDGWGSLASGATVPGWRGRGVQSALVDARLAHARACGCHTAVVTVTPGTPSHRNMLRAGFVPAYTRMELEIA
jgi:GNAT superfamily N-acetyltransferase